MDYDYETEEHYEGRVLWGRIAVYGVAFLFVFLLGNCLGGRGAADPDDIAALEAQVDALSEENEDLREHIDALSAGQQPPPPPDDEETGEDAEAEGSDGEAAATRTYIVQSGDTLTTIAREFYNDSTQWEVIAEANGLTRDTPLTVGQELVIPPLDEAADDE